MRKLFLFLWLIIGSLVAQGQIIRANSFARAQAAAEESNPLLDDCVAYWTLDEASGNAIDAVGDNDGTNTDATQNQAGKIGTSYLYGGTTSETTIGDIAALELAKFTVSFWFYSNGSGCPVTEYTSSAGWDIQFAAGTMYFNMRTTSTTTVTNNTTISANLWYHCVCTYDQENMRMYINGTAQTDVEARTTVNSYTGTSFLIANRQTDHAHWNSRLDEIGVWNRALIQDEVTELYNSGDGLTYPFE